MFLKIVYEISRYFISGNAVGITQDGTLREWDLPYLPDPFLKPPHELLHFLEVCEKKMTSKQTKPRSSSTKWQWRAFTYESTWQKTCFKEALLTRVGRRRPGWRWRRQWSQHRAKEGGEVKETETFEGLWSCSNCNKQGIPKSKGTFSFC